MRNVSDDNYSNSSFIVGKAMGQIPHSTDRISSIGTWSYKSLIQQAYLLLTVVELF